MLYMFLYVFVGYIREFTVLLWLPDGGSQDRVLEYQVRPHNEFKGLTLSTDSVMINNKCLNATTPTFFLRTPRLPCPWKKKLPARE
jgi:hypothetical protein